MISIPSSAHGHRFFSPFAVSLGATAKLEHVHWQEVRVPRGAVHELKIYFEIIRLILIIKRYVCITVNRYWYHAGHISNAVFKPGFSCYHLPALAPETQKTPRHDGIHRPHAKAPGVKRETHCRPRPQQGCRGATRTRCVSAWWRVTAAVAVECGIVLL